MKKRNWLNRKAVVIIMIVYAVILLAFGPPFADRKLTQGLSRRVAYQDTSFSQVVYKTGGVALFAVVAALILDLFCLGRYFRYLLREANTTQRAKRAIVLSKMLGLGLTVAWTLYGAVVISHLYLAHFSQDAALKEFARSRFVGSSAAVLVVIPFFVELVKWRRSWRKFTVDSVLAAYYCQECEKLQKANQYEAAEQMLAKACEQHPRNISLWASRAYLLEAFLDSPEEASVCLQNATGNLRENINVGDVEKAAYERFVGVIKARSGLIEEAIHHIDKSLKLHHDNSLAELLKELQKHGDERPE